MDISRRLAIELFAAPVLGFTAGCQSIGGSSRGVTDIFIKNEMRSRAELHVTVTDADEGHVRVDRTIELSSGEEKKINNEVVMETNNVVSVGVGDRFNREYDWENATEPLRITVSSDGISFDEE